MVLENMKNIWFTSDNHWNHRRIIELAERPFTSLKEMNDLMVNNWNKVVKPGDTVYHLGDFGFGNKDELEFILNSLNGNKILIRGSHDRSAVKLNGWLSILRSVVIYASHNISLALIHDPSKWKGHSPVEQKLIVVHGHWHGRKFLNPTKFPLFDVSVEAHKYTPVNIMEIVGRCST